MKLDEKSRKVQNTGYGKLQSPSPPRLQILMVKLNPTNCIEDSFPMCSLFQFVCIRTACSFWRYGCHRPANSFRQRRTRALLKPTVFALPKKLNFWHLFFDFYSVVILHANRLIHVWRFYSAKIFDYYYKSSNQSLNPLGQFSGDAKSFKYSSNKVMLKFVGSSSDKASLDVG